MFALDIELLKLFTPVLMGTVLSEEDFVLETSLCLFTPVHWIRLHGRGKQMQDSHCCE